MGQGFSGLNGLSWIFFIVFFLPQIARIFVSRRFCRFIAGGILPKLAWRLPCMSSPIVDQSTNAALQSDPLLQGQLEQGPKMSGVVARTPLVLIDGDAGVRGCLFVALKMLSTST